MIPLHRPDVVSFEVNPAPNVSQKTKRKITIKSNVAHTWIPLYYFSRINGLLPFSLVRDSNEEVQKARVTFFDIIWFVTSICLYLLMAYFSCYAIEIPDDPNQSKILYIGDNVLLVIGLIYGAVTIVMDMFNRHKLVEILKGFIAFDKEAMNLGFDIDYKMRRRRVIVWCLWTASLSLFLTASTFLTFRSTLSSCSTTFSVIFICILLFHHLIPAIILTTYFLLVFNQHYRFQVLNTLLRNRFLIKDEIRLTIKLSSKNDTVAFIKKIGRLHDSLTEIMEKVNRCYSLQVMINIGGTFIFSVLTVYIFYRYLLQQTEYYKHAARSHFDYDLFYAIYSYMVIYAGSIVAREGKKTSQIVHEVINNCKDVDINCSLTLLAQQVDHLHPVATCGLFVFDWTLLYTIVGATCTYLTILVQFDKPISSF